jgi:5-deoxy-glucuronate isomerase
MARLSTIAAPQDGSSRFVSLYCLEFEQPGSHIIETGSREYVIDLISGRCSAHLSTPKGDADYEQAGGRPDIFSGPPSYIYVPKDSTCRIECPKAGFLAMIYAAPTGQDADPAHITPDQVKLVEAGKPGWRRQVYIGLGDEGAATRMMVGETHGFPGNWSGFPPHRHSDPSQTGELELEELYYFFTRPAGGFIIGGTYSDPDHKDATAKLKIYNDRQAFDVPQGYHLLSPCPGYQVNYTWVLAGPQKGFGAWTEDPNLSWLNHFEG